MMSPYKKAKCIQILIIMVIFISNTPLRLCDYIYVESRWSLQWTGIAGIADATIS